MNLLIFTQKVDKNDDNLGFFHRWLEKFAEETGKIFVVANFVGERSLPANAQIFSLGKERKFGKIRRYFNFYKYLFRAIRQSDAVFVHMIPLWVILAWPVAALYRKKIYLWYTHKSITPPLRLAEKLAARIFTASPESCRLNSKKIIITGHGVDTEHFKPRGFGRDSQALKLLAVGRITPSKDYEFLIEAVSLLDKNFILDIVGEPITKSDVIYEQKLKKLVIKKNLAKKIIFLGGRTYARMPDIYNSHDILLHASETGSADKVVLEAMACGKEVATTSAAFRGVINVFPKNVRIYAERIAQMANAKSNLPLREIIIKNHNLNNLIEKILGNIKI